jgi:ABC-type lipoprotein release transport system permease subunit
VITGRTFAVLVVLAATAGAVAGTALGVSVAVWTDRLRNLWEPIEWEGVDE